LVFYLFSGGQRLFFCLAHCCEGLATQRRITPGILNYLFA
jgi:hypothetical protein